MNCRQTKELFPAYLDNEINPSERRLIQAHLAGCNACQRELALLSRTRNLVSQSLNIRAAQTAPSPQALSRLQARLADEALRPHLRLIARFRRSAPFAFRTRPKLFSGGVSMNKRNILAAGFAILVIAAVAMTTFTRISPLSGVTQVSAQEVLERAVQAQLHLEAETTQGIQHIRSENYFNLEGLAEDQGTNTILDSYGDLQSGNFRTVTFDGKTGKVLDAFAYDGTYTYSQDYNAEGGNDDPLTIYRTPQEQVAGLKPTVSGDGPSEKDLFEHMCTDPNVQLARQETWADGSKVYVLRSQQKMKVLVDGQIEQPDGLVTVYIDVGTYKQLGYRMTMEKDGQEILLGSQKILADETLPAGASVAWDLSDLQGIDIVDDPNREHVDLLPEVISEQDLAARTETGYLLKTIPEGYTLEISEPQRKAGSSEPYIYIASYRTEANDYFVIQSVGSRNEVEMQLKEADETYTTANGLVVYFMEERAASSDKQYISAIVETPDGTIFMVNSTLPRETVKTWAEELLPAK
jgi:hypothetical protein